MNPDRRFSNRFSTGFPTSLFKGFPARFTTTSQSLAVLIFIVMGITLPFINKAFHLDDTILVRLAEEQLRQPLSLGLPDYGFGGDFFTRYFDTHPPLIAGYIALLMRLFGSATEVGLHLGFVIFPVLAAVSMFFLARRFTDSPLVASLLLIVTPGIMVMSQSIMTDIPAVAFWLAAIAAYVFGIDHDDRRMLIVAAFFLGLAILTAYQSFSLLPLLLLYACLQRRINLRSLVPLGAALAVFAGIFIFYLAATGGPPKLSYAIGLNLTPGFIANKILASVSVLGGAIGFPVIIAAGLLRGKREYLYFTALLAALMVFFLLKTADGQYTVVSAMLQAVFYAAGLLVIYRFINAGIDAALSGQWHGRHSRHGDPIFLVLWIGGVLAYCILLLPYASTRYLLPLFPPVVLMLVRYARTIYPHKNQWQIFSVVAITATAFSGMAAAIADYQLSNIYRDFAASDLGSVKTINQRLWFAGEFGLRYYLEEGGATYLTRTDDSPVAGDHVILSHDLIAYYLSDDLKKRLAFERRVEFPAGWPVRVENRGSHAGFYDQFHGNLPYSLANGPIETIDIYTVTPSSGSSPSTP